MPLTFKSQWLLYTLPALIYKTQYCGHSVYLRVSYDYSNKLNEQAQTQSVYYEIQYFIYVLRVILFQMAIKKVKSNILTVVQVKLMIITLHFKFECVHWEPRNTG